MELIIGVVGAPNVGKSSFLNVTTRAKALVGDRPFVTIEPNYGLASFATPCLCARIKGVDKPVEICLLCKSSGLYRVPVKILDVAGLVPGASEGRGRGNAFLGDLCGAHVLIHVIDASGTTNERGEKTIDYDPRSDARWLREEIEAWIFGNVWSKWASMARRHLATRKPILETLQPLFGGYGAKRSVMDQVLKRMNLENPADLTDWNEGQVRELVNCFVEIRFPTILALNKIDQKSSEKWTGKLLELYPDATLLSAGVEHVLQSLAKKEIISYSLGDEQFEIIGVVPQVKKAQLEQISDFLFRFGSTGVSEAINAAVRKAGMRTVFVDDHAHLIPSGATFADLGEILYSKREIDSVVCRVSGKRLAQDDEIGINDAVSYQLKPKYD